MLYLSNDKVYKIRSDKAKFRIKSLNGIVYYDDKFIVVRDRMYVKLENMKLSRSNDWYSTSTVQYLTSKLEPGSNIEDCLIIPNSEYQSFTMSSYSKSIPFAIKEIRTGSVHLNLSLIEKRNYEKIISNLSMIDINTWICLTVVSYIAFPKAIQDAVLDLRLYSLAIVSYFKFQMCGIESRHIDLICRILNKESLYSLKHLSSKRLTNLNEERKSMIMSRLESDSITKVLKELYEEDMSFWVSP